VHQASPPKWPKRATESPRGPSCKEPLRPLYTTCIQPAHAPTHGLLGPSLRQRPPRHLTAAHRPSPACCPLREHERACFCGVPIVDRTSLHLPLFTELLILSSHAPDTEFSPSSPPVLIPFARPRSPSIARFESAERRSVRLSSTACGTTHVRAHLWAPQTLIAATTVEKQKRVHKLGRVCDRRRKKP
jgi:hypothetical protein